MSGATESMFTRDDALFSLCGLNYASGTDPGRLRAANIMDQRAPRSYTGSFDRRNQQNTPIAISGTPATRPSGLGPKSVCPTEQNTTPMLATALKAPCARAHGHTLPDRMRSNDSQQDMAVQSNVIVRMPAMGNPS